MNPARALPVSALLLVVLAAPAAAQGPVFQTPGMPGRKAATGSGSLTSSDFNPAIGFVLDGLLDYTDVSGGSSGDGIDLNLRTGEMSVAGFVDPKAWAYGIIVYAEEEVALEEGAVHYLGLGGNLTLRAGRFFADFGKQMQSHVHDLRTIERPAVLRAYLGDEMGGEGLQIDDWFSVGEETAVRYSLGVFGSLLPEGEEGGVEASSEGPRDPDELSFAARLTGFTDVGEGGTLQLGASARHVGDLAFEFADSADPGALREGLSNTAFGVDLTYGHVDETATRKTTVGGEVLLFTGDVGAEVVDAGVPGDPSDDVLAVIDDDLVGFYAFVDRQWSLQSSAGVQYSQVQLPEVGTPDLSEVDLHYTRHLSEFQRLRLFVTFADVEGGESATRVGLQYTNYLGPHSHGINW